MGVPNILSQISQVREHEITVPIAKAQANDRDCPVNNFQLEEVLGITPKNWNSDNLNNEETHIKFD